MIHFSEYASRGCESMTLNDKPRAVTYVTDASQLLLALALESAGQ